MFAPDFDATCNVTGFALQAVSDPQESSLIVKCGSLGYLLEPTIHGWSLLGRCAAKIAGAEQ